ncbi:MAG TPA: metallophosphoesterase family protein [Candidatus Cybelea sp.]|nr:metallophosphoesterase family protein [Candidatus Cybelea sp.]
MRVAALYDIHGNLPALEAVLSEVCREGIDRIIVGGDVLPGPLARESLEYLRALEIPTQFILGNGEVAVLEQMAGQQPASVPEPYRPMIRWNAEQLDSGQRRFIESWPKTVGLEMPGSGEVLFCHATPGDENQIFTRATPENRLRALFTGIRADVVVCGHTHMQFDRVVGDIRVVNAGSVGMPFGSPGADWLLVGREIQLRHTGYDLARAAERIRATNYPEANAFAAHNVLEPPSEAVMLAAFARAELK